MRALQKIHHEQSGYTVVEMIVTMALVTLVTGGMVSTFAIFDSVQTAWHDRNQARAVSVVAEEAIVQDASNYRVVTAGDTLALEAPSDCGGSTFTVTYRVEDNELRRTVKGQKYRVVAHGIARLEASTPNPGEVHVILSVVAADSRPQDPLVESGFDVSSRNPTRSLCAG